jgi:hypothetical protein
MFTNSAHYFLLHIREGGKDYIFGRFASKSRFKLLDESPYSAQAINIDGALSSRLSYTFLR